jgi:KDO2-lipid IV(A) lauroyltransferase
MMVEPLIRAALWLLRQVARLPDRWVRRLGHGLGDVLWWLALPRRRIALVNLALCFPQMPEAERRRLARQHFRCFGAGFLECFVFWHEPAERIAGLVRQAGREHFDALAGRPLIVLAPHFVGLDAGGVRMLLDSPGAAMFANQKSRALTEVMTRGRTRFLSRGMLLRNQGMRQVVRTVRSGVPFMFSPDMDLGPRDALFLPFFGVPCATVPALARLAQLSGARVLPMITRMAEHGYETTFLPPWDDFPGDDLEAATRRMNTFIEQCVLAMPEQYLWTHRRFKTRPPGEPSVYGR